MASILDFVDFGVKGIFNTYFDSFIGLATIENMGLDTKFESLGCLVFQLWHV